MFCKRSDLKKRLRPATLLKKRLLHRCFPVKFVKFLRTPFYIELFWSLLLERLVFRLHEVKSEEDSEDFSIHITNANCIKCVLEVMFKFVFSEMT